jgi:thiol:disulfide interchange protein DsbC
MPVARRHSLTEVPMKQIAIAFLLGCFCLSGCSATPTSSKAPAGHASTASAAKPAPSAAVAAPAQAPAAASVDAAVRKSIASLDPHAKIDSLRAAPVAGLTEVSVNGELLYITNDGKYAISGNIVQIAGKVNLTEQTRAAMRRTLLQAVTPAQTIVFAPPHPKYTVTVFTDVDCAYCRKLHSQIADYNNEGIAIRYLFFPRTGIGSESYNKAVAVWCSADRRRALTDAKAGLPVVLKNCNNPVTMDFDLGRRIGVEGTPAIYTADGTQIGGYVTPVEMKHALDELATNSHS